MQKYFSSQSGLLNPRALFGLTLCSVGVFLAMLSFAGMPRPKAKAPSAGPTTNFSNGITFEHGTWQDPIRMVGEPDIVIDHADGIYISGPGGSTTQASWFWKSTDHGDQFHLIGCPLKSNCQNGGGDTEIAVARNNDVFASDLQTLTCNSTLRSYDNGATWLPSEGCFPGTDRQWMGVYDPNASATGRRVYLSANGQANGCYFLVSTDNGVTYVPTGNATNNPGGSCIGRFAINPANGHIYVPGSSNTKVSLDGGATWLSRPRPSTVAGNLFANIAIDTAGNLYQGWITGNNAYISTSTDEGQTWSPRVQVSTGLASPLGDNPALRRLIFPWTVAGDPGRVAITFYATTDNIDGSTGPGSVNALWFPFVSISTNALSANPTWTQVQADEHPNHRGQICTGGTGCVVSMGDRSMADFYAIDIDTDGRLYLAYNENSDLSLVVPPSTYIGKPINGSIRLRTGPSLYAAKGNLLPSGSLPNVNITAASGSGPYSVQGTQGMPPGNWASDPAGDAPFPVVPVPSANHPALDILEVGVGDDGTNLTFTMKMADLSAAALADAVTAGGTPTWMVTWFESKGGVGPVMTSGPAYSHWYVKWLGQSVFEYGIVSSVNAPGLGAPAPKALSYVPSGTATGSVNGNIVTISAPLASMGGLVAGDKIEHIIAYSNVEHADATLNDWADQVKSFAYRIGTPLAGQHLSDGYVEVSGDNFATSTLAVLSATNNTWTASVSNVPSGTICARQILAKDLYTPVWDDVQAGPVSCVSVGPPQPVTVVSRKVHGGAGTFDIDLLPPAPGIECRTGGASGDFQMVITFPLTITMSSPTVTSGTGSVVSSSVSGNAVTVDLTGVTNAQRLTVTLNGVTDINGTGNVPVNMAVLLGDTNADTSVNSADIGQTKSQSGTAVTVSNFREDVTIDGNLNSADIGLVKSKSGTALP